MLTLGGLLIKLFCADFDLGLSMSDVMIRGANLGKKYVIGHQTEGRSHYGLLRDVLAEGAKSLVRLFTGRSPEKADLS